MYQRTYHDKSTHKRIWNVRISGIVKRSTPPIKVSAHCKNFPKFLLKAFERSTFSNWNYTKYSANNIADD